MFKAETPIVVAIAHPTFTANAVNVGCAIATTIGVSALNISLAIAPKEYALMNLRGLILLTRMETFTSTLNALIAASATVKLRNASASLVTKERVASARVAQMIAQATADVHSLRT